MADWCDAKISEAKDYLYDLLNVNALENADHLKFPACPDYILVNPDEIVVVGPSFVDGAFQDIYFECNGRDTSICQVRDGKTKQPIQLIDHMGRPTTVSRAQFNATRQWLLENYVTPANNSK